MRGRTDALPFAVSFVIGMVLLATCVGVAWAWIGRSVEVMTVFLTAAAVALAIGAVLETPFRLRGVLAGVIVAMALCVLTVGAGIAVLCSGMGRW
jgi:hypothetical protein